MDLKTEYLGLSLENPIIVSSCSLSKTADGVRRIADAGAGAVVLKSLFEEQMDLDTREIEQHIRPSWHTEAYDYVRNMGMQLGPREYLDLIGESKKNVSIPVIASLNCVSQRWWPEYAKKLETAGADAIELNIAFMPSHPGWDGHEIDMLHYQIVEKVKSQVSIPISVKTGPYFSSLSSLIQGLVSRGVRAMVLFNRFYQVDIDIDQMTLAPGYRFSTPEEMTLPLRWIALLSGQIECDFAATTGIHDSAGIIKLLLAGAKAVQICSVLYQKGLEQIKPMRKGIEQWMSDHDLQSIDDFRGRLSHAQTETPELWERLQYIKALVGIE